MNGVNNSLFLYTLEAALAADHAETNQCFVLNTGHIEKGDIVSSLKQIIEKINKFPLNIQSIAPLVMKLYIVGDWIPAPLQNEWKETEHHGSKKETEVRMNTFIGLLYSINAAGRLQWYFFTLQATEAAEAHCARNRMA